MPTSSQLIQSTLPTAILPSLMPATDAFCRPPPITFHFPPRLGIIALSPLPQQSIPPVQSIPVTRYALPNSCNNFSNKTKLLYFHTIKLQDHNSIDRSMAKKSRTMVATIKDAKKILGRGKKARTSTIDQTISSAAAGFKAKKKATKTRTMAETLKSASAAPKAKKVAKKAVKKAAVKKSKKVQKGKKAK